MPGDLHVGTSSLDGFRGEGVRGARGGEGWCVGREGDSTGGVTRVGEVCEACGGFEDWDVELCIGRWGRLLGWRLEASLLFLPLKQLSAPLFMANGVRFFSMISPVLHFSCVKLFFIFAHFIFSNNLSLKV